MSIGLLIADRHDPVRDGLHAILAPGDIIVVAEARKPWHVKPLARNPAVGMLVLAVSWGRFRGENGIDLLRDIRAEQPQLPILMYSVHDRVRLVEKCRRLGANGYCERRGRSIAAQGNSRGVRRGQLMGSPKAGVAHLMP